MSRSACPEPYCLDPGRWSDCTPCPKTMGGWLDYAMREMYVPVALFGLAFVLAAVALVIHARSIEPGGQE